MSKPPSRFDDVFIGAGQAGPFLAAKLAATGRKVALVERRALGGTCVNDGCMPTKTLVACARAAWVARNASNWGVVLEGAVRVDLKAVKARKDAVVREARAGLQTWLDGTQNLELIVGEGRFTGGHTIAVGERVLEAERFFLNVGTRPHLPALPGLDAVGALTNETVMELEVLPPHLVILGASAVGLEFAQVFRRFGSAVTIIGRAPRLAPREDEAVSQGLHDVFASEGIAMHLGAGADRITGGPGDFTVHVGALRVPGTHLLVALGRAPNTERLGLEAAGIATDARGFITTDDALCTALPHVWALGDANGRGAYTHTAYDDFQIVAANLLEGGHRRASDRIPIYALYTDPPLGRVGMDVKAARASGRKVLIGHRPMSKVGRARERGETAGFLQVLVDADTRLLLGATFLGIEADEAMHCIADTMYAHATVDVLRRAVHAHPTVSELIPTVLEGLEPLSSQAP